MENLLVSWIYSLLASGCICSLFLFINADGKIKNLLETACSCIMVLTFFSPFDKLPNVKDIGDILSDWSTVELNTYDHEAYEKAFIEAEYSAYICNEANKFSVGLNKVTVSAICDENDYWIPYEVIYDTDQPISIDFIQHITDTLGIPKERQYEHDENTMAARAEK